MISTVIFEDEITLYWVKEWEHSDSTKYRIILNGEELFITKKTHCSIRNLRPQTNYDIRIFRLETNTETLFFSETLQTKSQSKRIDITHAPYFAKGDGITLNTVAIQKAINNCKMGETVYIPKGIYLTGALDLHSDMELYLDKDAVLLGSKDVAAYSPKILSRFEGIELECYRPLLNIGVMDKNGGYTCQNVIIRGGGTIRGGGLDLAWSVINLEKELMKDYLETNQKSLKEYDNSNTLPGRKRPRLIAIHNTENVILSNLTIEYGPAWNVHFVYSKNILTYGCTIRSHGIWNGDGWDPDSSEDCTAFDVTFDTGDDGIAIKSGKNFEGALINRPTKNIKIFDCRGKDGIAIGSELSGGIENVFIWDCNMFDESSKRGFRIKTTKKRGGYVKNVMLQNCQFLNMEIFSGYQCNDDGKSAKTLTVMENFVFESITLKGKFNEATKHREEPLKIIGFDQLPIKNIKIKKLYLLNDDETLPHIILKNIENLSIEHITQESQTDP